jgi:hypothetical protein
MGGDCGTWIPQPHFDWQSPNLNSVGAPLDLGQQNPISAYMNPGTNMATTNGNLPVYAQPKMPHSWVGQTNEPQGWFYCLPRFRQGLTSDPKYPIAKGELPTNPYESCREAITPNAGPGCAQKRFVVVDQSKDQTTLIYSSGIGTPVQCLTSWSPKPNVAHDLNGVDRGYKRDSNDPSGPILTDEFNENPGNDEQSEMHEDTEELNALLYSDNEDYSEYSEDDEVTSTGHSPSTMTDHDKKDCFEGCTEEVASSAGPSKKRKLFDGGCNDVPSLMDTASSLKPRGPFEHNEEDAESSCASGYNVGTGEMGFLSGNKKLKKERIRETVNILQGIIPGVRGKDAIVVLDETIHYLKSLKLKAKALGLNAL